jgi:formylglycine-generating enzyme required for sulfatase activity
MTRASLRRPVLVAGLAAIGVLGSAPRSAQAQEPPALPWMASYEESKDQPVGMDESDVTAWLDKKLKSEWKANHVKRKEWDPIWKNVFLLMTPGVKVPVPAFRISKYEVTNAQWAKFLEFRRSKYATEGGESLTEVACRAWSLDAGRQGRDVKRGWQTLLRDNAAALMPVLNPKNEEKWDPEVARAPDAKLPKGLELSYPTYLPPEHWTDGRVPDHERKKPMRYVSWEQAVDFCDWAGLHLPTEHEWERAARGPEGRWFPWGNDWDPLKCIWEGFNAAAIRAANPAAPPIAKPGMEPDKETPFPADVDALPGGANPEGVLHLSGNVSEFTSSRALRYPGSNSTFQFEGAAIIARGGNFTDKAELLLAADRNAESHQGALLPSHAIDGYGFRVASYPNPGADLGYLLAQRYNEKKTLDGPFLWLPAAPGLADRKGDNTVYLGLDAQRAAGVLDRQMVPESPDHVFITGPATGLAFVPVKGFPMETVKSVGDLEKFGQIPDKAVVLGVLTGTEHSGITVNAAGDQPVVVPFSDPRLHYQSDERVQTSENIGVLLVYEAPRVLVYVPNETLKGAAKHRNGLLGALAAPAEFKVERGVTPPSARIESDGTAVLEASVPLLDRKGLVPSQGSSMRVTIRVPFVREVK